MLTDGGSLFRRQAEINSTIDQQKAILLLKGCMRCAYAGGLRFTPFIRSSVTI